MLRRPAGYRLGDRPPLHQVVRWIADLGGYTGKSSGGPPGPKVIGRGLLELRAAVRTIAPRLCGLPIRSSSSTDVRAAAQAANAHPLILRLPQGYETLVGERGMRLSGGERQRISIARAFLKDAPILILDEPTSSVDVRTEGAIVEAMERLMRGRTAFIIAHRPSTLKHCGVILRIEGGQVIAMAPSTANSRQQVLVRGARDRTQ